MSNEPMVSEVGCYVLHLYCVDPDCKASIRRPYHQEATGINLTEARRVARSWGWSMAPGARWTCPDCVRARR